MIVVNVSFVHINTKKDLWLITMSLVDVNYPYFPGFAHQDTKASMWQTWRKSY